jgi:hypothetical protein
MEKPEQNLQRVLDKSVDNKKVFGTSFAVKKDGFTWEGAAFPRSVYRAIAGMEEDLFSHEVRGRYPSV